MSNSRAWAELGDLWKTAEGVPDLRDFWARHPELPVVEQVQLLAWHEECKRALAAQLGLSAAETSQLPIGIVSGVDEGADMTPSESVPDGPESLSARLEHLPPLPPPDQAVEISVLRTQFPEISVVFEEGVASYDTPATDGSSREAAGQLDKSPAAEKTGSVDTIASSPMLSNRYRLDRLLGEGKYGRVWLGYDLELRRQVAIKVPLPERFQNAADAEQYRSEARTVASLPHHAHLVPVYDVGRMANGAIYVVSGYVAGTTLQAELKQGPPTLDRAVEVLRAIADALLHAHARGLIHRDVKPANILIEAATRSPYLSDFGLAVREDDSLAAAPAGSPAYMSPEQAVLGGQPLDGRSDLFSLGILAYEMFTGKLPFRGKRVSDFIQAILSSEPVPPHELRHELPLELERICLRLLQKRPSDRYSNAAELMVDLEAWGNRSQPVASPGEEPPVETVVNPPGLRAFTAEDAGSFLGLLPGQVDRHGLPESVAFWKRRIEATDETFRVGLVLGPSGSGKSSLVRAGVLPRLSAEITSVYLAATAEATEEDLLRAVRSAIPAVPSHLSLVDTFRWLRKRAGKEAPAKTVLVMDQFEQWLNTHPVSASVELVQALAHCDGRRLQALLLVRDDFGVAANRLLRKLDIPLVDRQTCLIVDLFDVEHAERVLVKLGRGYGAFPRPPAELSESQREFCRQATALLAENGQVVPVRLALLAELLRRKAWEPVTLSAYGGAEGIGVAFLEETLGERSVNPRFREVSGVARGVLEALLPGAGMEIRGHQRSVSELAGELGLQAESQQLTDALAVLDSELRLITVTETGREKRGGPARYQLTHDFLVPSLRRWLEKLQGRSKEGRAKLLLRERSRVWTEQPQDRHLPTLGEHLRIRRWTPAGERTEPERRMLSRAAVVHGRAVGLALLLAMVLGPLWIWPWWKADQYLKEKTVAEVEKTVAEAEKEVVENENEVLRSLLYEEQIEQKYLEKNLDERPGGARAATGLVPQLDRFGPATFREARLAVQEQVNQRELRAIVEAQSVPSIATLARDARLDGVAILAELQALPLLQGAMREAGVLRVQGATARTLTMVEQSPRRGITSRVAFIGQGDRFLSADHVTVGLRIWNRETATQVATLEGHRTLPAKERKGPYSSLGGLAVDGEKAGVAVTCGIDGQVIQWDLVSQAPRRKVAPLSDRKAGWTALGAVNGRLSPELDQVVAGSHAGDLVWLDRETLEVRHRVIAAHKGAIRAIAPGPGGLIATGGEDGAVRLWSRRDGVWPEQGEVLRPEAKGIIRCLAFSADGATLLVGGTFPDVEFWSTQDRRMLRQAAGHADNDGQQATLCAIPLPNQAFLTGGTDGRVIQWNVADATRLREFSYNTTVTEKPTPVRDLTLDSKGQNLLVSLLEGTLVEVDFPTGKPRVRGAGPMYRFSASLIETDVQAAISGDGKTIALGSEQLDGSVALWPTNDLGTARYLDGLDELRDPEGDFEAPTALALSKGAEMIALGTPAGEVVVRSVAGELLWRKRVIKKPTGDPLGLPPIVALRFSPADSQLVAVSGDGLLSAWGARDGAELWTRPLRPKTKLMQYISDELLVTAGDSGRIQGWSTTSGELVREWGTPGDVVSSLMVTRDRRGLVTGNDQGLITTWDIATRKLKEQFMIPDIFRRHYRVPPEGRQPPETDSRARRVLGMAQWGKSTDLAVTLGDGSLAIVDVSERVVLARTLVHEGVIYRAGDRLNWSCDVFLDSQQRLCTVGSDRTIRRWQLGHTRPGTRLAKLGEKQGLVQLEPSRKHGWFGLVDGQNLACQPGNLAQPAWERTHSLVGDQFSGFSQFPDGRIAAGRRKGPALVWNPADGSVQECPAKRLAGFKALAAASPRDNLVATTISPTAVILWKPDGDQTGSPKGLPDTDLKRVVVHFDPAKDRTIQVLQFSPAGDQLLAITELGELVTWKVEGVELIPEEYGAKVPTLSDARYSVDGRRVFQVGSTGVVVWDPRNLEQPVSTFNWHDLALLENAGLVRAVHSIACSSDGQWLATTGQDGTVRLGRYDTETDTATLVATLGLNDLAVDPSADQGGPTLAEQLRRLKQHLFFVRFSADDKQLVLVSEEKSVGLVDLEPLLKWSRLDEPTTWEELRASTGMRMRPDQTIQILDRNRLR